MLLQRVITNCAPKIRQLYWQYGRDPTYGPGPSSACLNEFQRLTFSYGTLLSFESYFGAFFEHQWNLYCDLTSVTLSVHVAGRCDLRVFRVAPDGTRELLYETKITGAHQSSRINRPPQSEGACSAGFLFFELSACSENAELLAAEWISDEACKASGGLALVIPTFNRDNSLFQLIDRVVKDEQLTGRLTRIVVVNQGEHGLAERLEATNLASDSYRQLVTIIEQENFGGAGGYARGILEILDETATTHVCLMDDDVQLESESLFRMTSFFKLSQPDLALGGHMLDITKPDFLYEAGARINPEDLNVHRLKPDLNIGQKENLTRMLHIEPMHYNGWWCFGFPVAFIQELGMPLPCFIRGDDAEFGMRLHRAGRATVSLPGVAVWHAPFLPRTGDWHLYYEVRNVLVMAAIYFEKDRLSLASLVGGRVLELLLTFRYQAAALTLRALQDFVHGPNILEDHPAATHASVQALAKKFERTFVRREMVILEADLRRPSRTRFGFIIALTVNLARNALRPSSTDAAPRRITEDNLYWDRIANSEHLAVDQKSVQHLITFRRSREHFRHIASQAWRDVAAAFRGDAGIRHAWRARHSKITTISFWRDYLGL